MRLQRANYLLIPCLVVFLTAQASAVVEFEIGDVNVDANGGNFTISATPSPDAVTVGTYSTAVQFSNFSNLSQFAFNFDDGVLSDGMADAGPVFGTTPSPGIVASGNSVRFVGLGLGGVTYDANTKASMIKVNFTVAGGFNEGSSFDVGFVDDILLNNFGDPTTVGAPALGQGQTIAAVPEPSAFLLIGLVAMMAGGVNWFRRRRNAK